MRSKNFFYSKLCSLNFCKIFCLQDLKRKFFSHFKKVINQNCLNFKSTKWKSNIVWNEKQKFNKTINGNEINIFPILKNFKIGFCWNEESYCVFVLHNFVLFLSIYWIRIFCFTRSISVGKSQEGKTYNRKNLFEIWAKMVLKLKEYLSPKVNF